MASKIISPYCVWKYLYKNFCFDVLGRTFITFFTGNLGENVVHILICDVSNSTHLEMSMTKNIRLHPKYLHPPTYFKLYLRLHSFLRKQFVILLKGISSLQRKYLIAGIRLHMYFTKGQIISDQICGVLKFSKKAMKYCQDFCPSL